MQDALCSWVLLCQGYSPNYGNEHFYIDMVHVDRWITFNSFSLTLWTNHCMTQCHIALSLSLSQQIVVGEIRSLQNDRTDCLWHLLKFLLIHAVLKFLVGEEFSALKKFHLLGICLTDWLTDWLTLNLQIPARRLDPWEILLEQLPQNLDSQLVRTCEGRQLPVSR